MPDLGPDALDMVGAARDFYLPSPEELRRVKSGVDRSVAGGVEPRGDGAPPRENEAAAQPFPRIFAAVALVAIAAVVAAIVWWWPTAQLEQPTGSAPEDAAAIYEAQDDPEEGSAKNRRPRVEAAEVPDEEPEPPLPAPQPQPRAKKQTPKPERAPLSAELEVLRRARAAMDAGRHGDVLQVVREYQRTYPRGAFAQEAAALRVLAMCKSNHKRAKKNALRFLSRYPASLTAPRVRKACGLE